MVNISTAPKEFRSQVKHVKRTTKCKDGQSHPICVDTDGKVRSNMQFTSDMRGYFLLYVLTNDTAGNDTTIVKVLFHFIILIYNLHITDMDQGNN